MKPLFIAMLLLMFLFASSTEFDKAAAVTASEPPQRGGQVGVTCVASPYCPDCVNGGNVCQITKEFFGGITGVLAKKYMIEKCRRANALDYCGGSYGCVRKKGWTPQDGDRYRAKYGGGCYKSCDKSVVCYPDSR